MDITLADLGRYTGISPDEGVPLSNIGRVDAGEPPLATTIDPRVIADVFGPRRSVLGDPGVMLWGKTPPYTGYGRNSTAELSIAPEAPSQEYNNRVTENLLSLGVSPRVAEAIGPKLGGALQLFSPVGIVTSGEDAAYYANRGEYPSMVAAALGLIPAAGRPVGTVAGKAINAVAREGSSLAGGAASLVRRPPAQTAVAAEARPFYAVRQDTDEAGASLYPFETALQRPYALDYPAAATASRSGPPLVTMDNDKVVAKRLVGRQKIGGPDVPMSEAGLYESAQDLTGNPVRFVPRQELRDQRNVAEYWPDKSQIVVWENLTPGARYQAIGHELGHHAHEVNPEMLRALKLRPDLQAELAPLYSWGYEGRHISPLTTPQTLKYHPDDIIPELAAELYRLALTNPNSGKTFAPKSSEFLRQQHNNNEKLNWSFQVNSLLGAAGLGALAYPGMQEETGER